LPLKTQKQLIARIVEWKYRILLAIRRFFAVINAGTNGGTKEEKTKRKQVTKKWFALVVEKSSFPIPIKAKSTAHMSAISRLATRARQLTMDKDKQLNYERYLIGINTLKSLINASILDEKDYSKYERELALKYGFKTNSIYRKTQLDITSF
jgi:hypothetical protein